MTPAGPDTLEKELAGLARDADGDGDPEGRVVALLRAHRLLGHAVPRELGGEGGDLTALAALAHRIGGASPGAGVLWVMHCQQVAILRDHAPEPLRTRVLRRVAERQLLLGSVTTEPRKGGHVLTAHAAARADGAAVAFRRAAPVVSGGAHADAFLLSLRRTEDSAPDDVVLVYADRAQSGATVLGPLDLMGMRAAGNVAMEFSGRVPAGQVIDPEGGFTRITLRTLAPVGHLGWAACWTGAARRALRQVVALLRSGTLTRTDSAYHALARARARIDGAEALVLAALAEHRARSAPLPGEDPDRAGARLDAPAFQILVNNVKLTVSEETCAAVDALLGLAGLAWGYRRDAGTDLERLFRDLRAAPLMYGNDRLAAASGRLAVMDRAACSFPDTGLDALLTEGGEVR
ncbi:acyl-CoA dehydrogenase family protein [Streptomyces sp. NPDC059631]|uniref:acyl-CoA dehydrogenase family protein n=1 Tax=unclassified Streptomyces TaxID=2593676 RepID=UPI003681371F